MVRARGVFGVGIGSAAGVYLDLARAGVSRITVVDHDVVELKNLSTQPYHLEDVGSPKALALQRQLYRINPHGSFHGLNLDFLEIPDSDLDRAVDGADVLLFTTDSFRAQARGNMVCLKSAKPAVFAATYYRARCAEVFFSIPGVTPACYRCATGARYRAYDRGYQNQVTSAGATVFHSTYVNAVVGMLTMAAMENGGSSPNEFSNWFGSVWTHNLLLLQMHPDFGHEARSPFHPAQTSPADLNFRCEWRYVEPKCPPKFERCPDCQGTGDLRSCAESIGATRRPLLSGGEDPSPRLHDRFPEEQCSGRWSDAQRSAQQSPPAYPEGREDAPFGSAEA